MAVPVTVVLVSDGTEPRELTPRANTIRWASAAVGGFADASFSLDGFVSLPYLSLFRIFYAGELAWEGQVEDIRFQLSAGQKTTEVQAFGLQRLLTRTSVRRVWSKRDINWRESVIPPGSASGSITRRTSVAITTGNFLTSDLSKAGVQAAGTGAALAANEGNFAETVVGLSGLTLVRAMADLTLSGANTGAGKLNAFYHDTTDGFTTVAAGASYTASQALNIALTAGANGIRFGMYLNGVGLTATASDLAQFTNIRLLGTSLTEDATGGFYGGTVLRDLIALVPGLTPGLIEDGSDFAISAIERAVRSACLDVVQEVAGYYTREWGVWEDGRFDWLARNLDEPQNIVTLAQLDSLDLDGSIQDNAAVTYVLYTDAASDLDAEASSAATNQRNPFVKQGKTMDYLAQPGFPMTSVTAPQVASRITSDRGQWPAASGTITLPLTANVQNTVGSAKPAALVRGGENILIADMPKDDVFAQGRDGQTLFHVVSAETDLEAGTVTLTIEAQLRASDVILARLAAVTRNVTG